MRGCQFVGTLIFSPHGADWDKPPAVTPRYTDQQGAHLTAETQPIDQQDFQGAVAQVLNAKVLGEAGRLLELFSYLAGRGADAPAASQAEIAELVFGQTDASADDATVRVYIHRLRKRLDDYYAALPDAEDNARLVIPAGMYALRLQLPVAPVADDGASPVAITAADNPARGKSLWFGLAALGLLLLAIGAFYAGRTTSTAGTIPKPNAIWQPFIASARPTLIVLGDYYIFGEIDPVRPEEGRLVRDFRVNSPADLLRLQEQFPERYANADDVGLNYLPFSSAYGMLHLAPLLEAAGQEVSVIPASEMQPDMLNKFDVVYIGLFSGMGLLEDANFAGSQLALGESYDELIDAAAKKRYTSDEARALATPAYYRDYGYISRFKAPGGAWVAIVAGARDTGLRGLAPLVATASLDPAMAEAAKADDFEALFQVTGQQGADLSKRLLFARERTAKP